MIYLNMIQKENFELYRDYLSRAALTRAVEHDALIFGINRGTTACGACVVTVADEAELLWFYVAPEARNGGVGRNAFFELMLLLREQNVSLLRAELAPEARFLRRIFGTYGASFSELPEGVMRISMKALRETEGLSGKHTKSIPLSAATKEQLSGLLSEMTATGASLIPLPFDPEDYDTDVSAVFLSGNKAKGILLAGPEGGRLSVGTVYGSGEEKEALMDLFRFFLDAAEQKYGAERSVDLLLVQPRMIAAVKKLIKGSFLPAEEVSLSLLRLDYAAEKADRFVSDYLGEPGSLDTSREKE